ncbi:hypothetical protein ACFOHY_24660 [Rhizobium rosettiformans]
MLIQVVEQNVGTRPKPSIAFKSQSDPVVEANNDVEAVYHKIFEVIE